MRTAIYLLLLVSLACLFPDGASQQQASRPVICSTLTVSSPDEVDVAKPYTFTANVSGISADTKLKYNWTVSGGTILEGQGTSSIKVDLSGLEIPEVTATVEVEGVEPSCANKASGSTPIRCILDRLFDQYGNISTEDEHARLDNFAIQLQNEPQARGYIMAYGGRVTYAGEALERLARAKDYLTRTYNFMDERIVTTDGGYREDLTFELWIIPLDVTPPTPTPTLQPEDVQFIARPIKRKPLRKPKG